MALVNMRDMLYHAYRHRYAVGAFNPAGLDVLEEVMDAAERCRAAVILSLAEAQAEHLDFELLLPAVEAAAQRATVPVAIELDRGSSIESAVWAIRLGFNAVTVDASREPLFDHIDRTRSVVEMGRACGVPVGAALGDVPGLEGEDTALPSAASAHTGVAAVKAFVERTGVDFLTVSAGVAPARGQGEPKWDGHRLEQIHAALGLPLAIDVDPALGEGGLRGLIAHGVSKINHCTAFADGAGEFMEGDRHGSSPQGYTGPDQAVRGAIGVEAERCMRAGGSAGRAAEILAQCRDWLPVEHLIVYNVVGISEHQVQTMMAEGRRRLANIPGVRSVTTGRAVKDDARYRYAWLVRFVHPAVIDSYREHPDHVAFADGLFRPVAGDRISIDYQLVVSGPGDAAFAGDPSTRAGGPL